MYKTIVELQHEHNCLSTDGEYNAKKHRRITSQSPSQLALHYAELLNCLDMTWPPTGLQKAFRSFRFEAIKLTDTYIMFQVHECLSDAKKPTKSKRNPLIRNYRFSNCLFIGFKLQWHCHLLAPPQSHLQLLLISQCTASNSSKLPFYEKKISVIENTTAFSCFLGLSTWP